MTDTTALDKDNSHCDTDEHLDTVVVNYVVVFDYNTVRSYYMDSDSDNMVNLYSADRYVAVLALLERFAVEHFEAHGEVVDNN